MGFGASVLSGIESALWDLKGKLLGLPVYELLGGRCHNRLLAYATGGPSNYPEDHLKAKMDFYLGLGFRAFKVGAGYWDDDRGAPVDPHTRSGTVEMEAGKAALMREHVGPDIAILMDGHMGNPQSATWDVETAKAVLKALEPFDLFLFEEPLPYTDPWGYAELVRSTTVPVAGGECLTTLNEFRQFADLGSLKIAQLDAAFMGGLEEFIRVARMFDAAARQDRHALVGRGRRPDAEHPRRVRRAQHRHPGDPAGGRPAAHRAVGRLLRDEGRLRAAAASPRPGRAPERRNQGQIPVRTGHRRVQQRAGQDPDQLS